jgi:tetratricopeptide (TPR) repeat protein
MRTRTVWLGVVALFALAALGYLAVRLFRGPEIKVRVAADAIFRNQTDWKELIRRRIEAVSGLYRRNGGPTWKAVDFVPWDAPVNARPMNLRSAVGLGDADVLLAVTGLPAREGGGAVPFSNALVVSQPPGQNEQDAVRLLAHELAHLFGAGHRSEASGTLMAEPPAGEVFDPLAAGLIRDLRRHRFRGGARGMESGDEQRVLEALARAYNKGPVKPAARARHILGASCIRDGAPAAAVRHLREAVKIDPAFHLARADLAAALAADHHRDEAIAELRELIRRDADGFAVHGALAELLASRGDRREAVQHAALAVRKNPRNPALFLLLGRMLLETPGEIEKGIAAIRQATALAPDNPVAHQALASAESLRNRALADADVRRKAVAVNPDDAAARHNLAMALIRAGNTEAARGELEQVLRLRPNFADARVNLAVLLYGQGDPAGAWREIQAAQKLGRAVDPEFVNQVRGKISPRP